MDGLIVIPKRKLGESPGKNYLASQPSSSGISGYANFQFGPDANKPANPAIGTSYLATDTGILYVCIIAGSWTVDIGFGLGADQDVDTVFAAWTETTSGSGATGILPRRILCDGNSGSASRYRLNRSGNTYNSDFSKSYIVEWLAAIVDYASGVAGGWASWKLSSTPGNQSLTNKGFGFYATGVGALNAIGHDGTTLTDLSTGTTMTEGTAYRLRVIFIPGTILIWQVNNSIVASITSNLPSGTLANGEQIDVTAVGNAGERLQATLNRLFYRRGW